MTNDHDAWLARQAQRRLDEEARFAASRRRLDEWEQLSWEARGFLSQKLYSLIEDLGPYVDGTMGDIPASLVSVYVKACDMLARMHQLSKPPELPAAPLDVEPSVGEVDPVAQLAGSRLAVLGQLVGVRERLKVEAS